MSTIAERLAEEFSELPLSTVVRVFTDCTATMPQARHGEVERAARDALANLLTSPASGTAG